MRPARRGRNAKAMTNPAMRAPPRRPRAWG